MYATRPSDGETVSFDEMSVSELYELHYNEETYVAQEALKLPAFSSERGEKLGKGYRFVTELMKVRDTKEFGAPNTIFGAGLGSAKALVKLVKQTLKERNDVLLCEIGVGSGLALQKVLKEINSPKLDIIGCDISISEQVRELLASVKLSDMPAYDFIKTLPDCSIDILFSDNVFEHFCPDEAKVIYDELSKKLKPNATLLIIIPNSHIGPFDISRKFLPMGAKSTGFHYTEMTFNEVTQVFAEYGIRQRYCVFYIPKIQTFVLIKSRMLIKLKLKLEGFFAKIPIKILKFIAFYCGGYHISVLRKASK